MFILPHSSRFSQSKLGLAGEGKDLENSEVSCHGTVVSTALISGVPMDSPHFDGIASLMMKPILAKTCFLAEEAVA